MAENGLTAADVAVLSDRDRGYGYGGYGYGDGFGGGWIWMIVILFAFMGNGFGWGNNGLNNIATTDFVSSEFTQRDISQLGTEVNNGFQNSNNLVNAGFARTNDNLCDLKTNVLTGDMGLSNQILENRYANQLAECQTQRDILTQTNELNTNLLTTALQGQAHLDQCCCDIKELIRADGDETRALITANTIQDLRDRLTAAQDVISDQRTEANIINAVRPYPVPAYITGSSPYQSVFPFYGNGFYGNGFFGNTIV